MTVTEVDPTDKSHLDLLKLFHYLNGVLYFFFALIPTVHITMGLLMVFSPESMGNSSSGPPPALFGWMFFFIGVVVMVMIAALGVCQIIAARSIGSYRRYMFILVVSALNCLNMPLGTTLGVFTFIVLLRPSVKALFTGREPLTSPYRS